MTYSPILIAHICAGLIAVLAGFAALFVRKGSPLHRQTGDVFVITMLIMSAGGAYLGLMKSQRMNVVAGLFTFYLVSTCTEISKGAGVREMTHSSRRVVDIAIKPV